jgi:hypothetical protein
MRGGLEEWLCDDFEQAANLHLPLLPPGSTSARVRTPTSPQPPHTIEPGKLLA